jgi:hypothetical protein
MENIAWGRFFSELQIYYKICKKSSRAPNKILRGHVGTRGHTVGDHWSSITNRTQRFGSCICFLLQVKGWEDTI